MDTTTAIITAGVIGATPSLLTFVTILFKDWNAGRVKIVMRNGLHSTDPTTVEGGVSYFIEIINMSQFAITVRQGQYQKEKKEGYGAATGIYHNRGAGTREANEPVRLRPRQSYTVYTSLASLDEFTQQTVYYRVETECGVVKYRKLRIPKVDVDYDQAGNSKITLR